MTLILFNNIFLRNRRIIKVGFNVIQTATITGWKTRGKPICLPAAFPYEEKRFRWYHEFFDSTMVKFCQENARIIVVEGPIGVGKSAFCKLLAEEFGMLYMPQSTMDAHYVLPSGYDLRQHDDELPELVRTYDHRNFCIDPKNFKAGVFQCKMMELRFFQYVDAVCHLLNTGQGVVLERSYFSDYVFLKSMYEMKYVSKHIAKAYHTVLLNTSGCLMPPHLVIYLDIPVPIVQERIRTRNYSWEQNSPALTTDYLSKLEKNWKENYLKKASKTSEILIYDWTDGGDVEVVVDDIEKIDFDPLRRDQKFKSWWLSRKDLNALRNLVTNFPYKFLSYFYYPWFEIDGMVVPDDIVSQLETSRRNIPECRYDEGYNPLMGDKIINILFNSKTKNHRRWKGYLNHYYSNLLKFI